MPSKSVPMPTWSMPATRDDVVEVGDERLSGGRGMRAAKSRSIRLEAWKGMGWPRAAYLAARAACARCAFGFEGDEGLAVGLVDEGGVEVDHDGAAVGGDGAELIVGEVAGRVAEGAGAGVRREDGGAGDGEDVGEGLVGDVGDVDHHAEAVHLGDDLAAEGGEAGRDGGVWGWVAEVAGGFGPVVGVGPGEGHVADAEGVVDAEEGEGVLDGVAAFDAHEDGELSGGVGGEDVGWGEAEGEVVGMAADLFEDGVDEGEGAVGEAAGPVRAGSGQMAKNSAARLPARAEARLRWPVPRGEAGEVPVRRIHLPACAGGCRRGCR